MTWNNLQIQRRRWKQLYDIFHESTNKPTVSPDGMKDHKNFTVMTNKRITAKQWATLKREGYEVKDISILYSDVLSIHLTCRYDFEKQNQYIQNVAKEIGTKSLDALNYEIVKRNSKREKDEFNVLQRQFSDYIIRTRKKEENFRDTIRMLSTRVLKLRNIAQT